MVMLDSFSFRMIPLYSQQSGDIQARYVPRKDPGRNQSTRFKSGVLLAGKV